MRVRHSLPLLAASALLCSLSGLKAETNGMSESLTVGHDGKPLTTFGEFANAFDAPGFARNLESWGMENHTCKREVLRDVITACKAKGIRVMLYIRVGIFKPNKHP